MDIYLRKVENDLKDKKMLFQWRNDSLCRKYSIQSNDITYAEHSEWFDKKMADNNCYMYVAVNVSQAVGQIRIEIKEKEGIISYSVAREFRGKGIGSRILYEIEHQPEICKLVDKLVGVVKKENIYSQKCFEKMNYMKKTGEDGLYYYTKKITD